MTPRILSEGKTPAGWVAELSAAGVEISERTLREKARQLGAYRSLGNAIVLLPEHIDQIFEEPACPTRKELSSSTHAAATGGSKAVDLITTDISERALARLTELSRKPNSKKYTGRRGSVVSLDQMRRNQKTN